VRGSTRDCSVQVDKCIYPPRSSSCISTNTWPCIQTAWFPAQLCGKGFSAGWLTRNLLPAFKGYSFHSQIDSYKTYQNNKDKSSAELSFNTVVTKFFDVMNNFKPKTYGQRKDGVKNLISDKLYQQYFSNKGTYGDSNSVSAKLNQLNLYTQSKQGQNMKGLAVVSYQSKSGDNDWQKATVLYQVTFDTTTNRITAVQNLGSSFKASDLN